MEPEDRKHSPGDKVYDYGISEWAKVVGYQGDTGFMEIRYISEGAFDGIKVYLKEQTCLSESEALIMMLKA